MAAIEEGVPEEYKRLGGRSLTSTIIDREVPADADPLGDRNKLVFAPGLLAGINASSVHRLSLGSKSPLTAGIKESNSGGTFALKLAHLGIKALIIEGFPSFTDYKILKIRKNGVEFLDGQKYSHLKTVEAAETLRKDFGEKLSMAIIGPAGVHRLLTASVVVTDKDGVASRHLGRGGLGAVMGSKNIKAILIDDSDSEPLIVRDKNLLDEGIAQYTRALLKSPQTSNLYTNYGTAAMVEVTNALGGMPTRNFSQGRFEEADKVNGDALRDRIIERRGDTSHACMPGCVIRSSNIYCDKEGKEVVRSFEYETIVLCGTNLGISDLDAIAEFNAAINNLGMDTIDTGGAIGVAMDAGIIRFGDIDGVRSLIKEIETDSPLGRLLGSGTAITGKVLGVKRIPAAKGQGFPGYDPRVIKGHGVTYATSPMGADHTAGMNIREGLTCSLKEGQVQSSIQVQKLAAIYDSLGVCLFAHMAVKDNLDILTNMLAGLYGEPWDKESLYNLAVHTIKTEIGFNRRAGLGTASDNIPEIFLNEKLEPTGNVFDVDKNEMKKGMAGF